LLLINVVLYARSPGIRPPITVRNHTKTFVFANSGPKKKGGPRPFLFFLYKPKEKGWVVAIKNNDCRQVSI